jgi:hypothetical protein
MITVHFNQVFKETDIALGNHLFQYAVCRTVAIRNGYNFYIPYSGKLLKCFPNLDMGICDGDISQVFPDTNGYNPAIYGVSNFTHLQGNYQSVKYYEDYEDLIKEWYKIEMDSDTEKVLEKYPIEEYCFIHLRGNSNKSSWLMLPKSFYEKGIEKIKEINPNMKFVIVTDDYETSKEYFPELDIICGDYENIMVDFKVLYYAKYAIISNSTFSWWPRWLSEGGITFAPLNWLNYNIGGGFNPVDINTNKFIYIHHDNN